MIVGITGGSGCGKTTALRAFAELGGVILDCDAIYHELLLTDQAMMEAIAERFPGTVENGVLDRKKLGAIVFLDENALLDLNAITHGAVKREVVRRLKSEKSPTAIDAIGLFEGGLAELCHTTVAVTAPREDRVTRLMTRDGISREYAQARIDAQRTCEDFSALCDYTLHNDGTQQQFQQKCLAFFEGLDIMKKEDPKGE